jgi:hypothetical protein
MSLAFAGFPVATFRTVADPKMLALATVRANCDRKGQCFKTQRVLSAEAGMALGTFNRQIAVLRMRGVVALLYRGRRRSAVIVILPEHCWVTPGKPAPTASECSTRWNTKSKASLKEKEPPVAPDAVGGDAPQFDDLGKVAESALQRFGCCQRCGAVRQVAAPAPCQQCGSTRRTPYRQPRPPRNPRGPRRRQRGAEIMAAAMAAADKLIMEKFGPAEAPPPDAAPVAISPPPEIIPPNTGGVIAFPCQPLQRRRGFSPATDILEAAHHAAERFIAEHCSRDCGDHRDVARPLLAAGRDAGSPAIDHEGVA